MIDLSNETNLLAKPSLSTYIDKFGAYFRVYRRDNRLKALFYLEGLFHNCKSNIEKMDEQVKDSVYQSLHHFISVSPWDHNAVLRAVRADISELLSTQANKRVGLLLDETGHRKRGKKSVGVARQYLGSIGKTDNGQVAVLAVLNCGDDNAMVDARLFLPKEWTDDPKRCSKAGIPKEHCKFRTKPELALEMIKSMQVEVDYDWVGGDSIYGRSPTLRKGITHLGRLFVMDTWEKQRIYLKHPRPYIPNNKEGKGRPKAAYVSDQEATTAMAWAKGLTEQNWKTVQVRRGTKGPIVRQVAIQKVYVWSDKRPTKPKPEELLLIVSRNVDGTQIKYSLTNDITRNPNDADDIHELLYRQMQRYWVERSIQDAKDALGMTDYQVRGWRAWYHHMTLTIMALHYILEQKILHQKKIPLLSCHDIKLFFALSLERKAQNPDQVWELIRKRHRKRQYDIDRRNQ